MIDPFQFGLLIVRPALHRLGLQSLAAERLLLGTALVESGLRHLKQIRGPALGFYQIEPATARDLTDNWLRFRPDWAAKIELFVVPSQPRINQLVTNLTYATAIARLIYYRRPEPLPPADDLRGLAEYYKQYYNTPLGKGTPARFMAAVQRHWHGPAFLDDADAKTPKPARLHLRRSTPMPSGFGYPTPPQWTDFIKRHPDQAGAKPTRVYLSAAKLEELINVKRQVARDHPYRHDPGKDIWSVLEGRQPGDCEDLALTLRAHLAALGWPLGALRLAICKTPAGDGHAVLCIHTTVGVYIADNRLDHIASWAGLPYEWICRLEGARWVMILPRKV